MLIGKQIGKIWLRAFSMIFFSRRAWCTYFPILNPGSAYIWDGFSWGAISPSEVHISPPHLLLSARKPATANFLEHQKYM